MRRTPTISTRNTTHASRAILVRIFVSDHSTTLTYARFHYKGKSKSKEKENAKKSASKSAKSGKGRIDKSMIGAPSNFQHVGHIGYTEQDGFSSRGVDESFTAIVNDVSRYGITEKQLKKDEKFVHQFLDKARKEGLEAANAALGVPGAGVPAVPKAAKPPPPPAPHRAAPATADPPSPSKVNLAL